MADCKKETGAETSVAAECEKRNRKRFFIRLVAILSVCCLTAAVMAVAAEAVTDTVWRRILRFAAITVFCGGVHAVLEIEYRTGCYRCQNCGRTHLPSFPRFLLACNFGTGKIFTCPYCKQRGLHKKVFNRSSMSGRI